MKRKRKTWRCFHCDEVFRSRKAAWLHFGDDQACVTDVPACIDPLRNDEKARMKQVREANAWAVERDRYAIEQEDRADIVEMQLEEFKRLTHCSSVHELRMWMDSQNGRVVTANALIDGFRAADPDLADRIIG